MTLDDIINSRETDVREYKRALTVKMDELGTARNSIKEILNVGDSFISRWVSHYKSSGNDASSLLLPYQGSESYLTEQEKRQVSTYLENRQAITLLEFKKYILETYQVSYKSDQSYYDLLKAGNQSWKKTQKKSGQR